MNAIIVAAILGVSPSTFYSGLDNQPVPASVFYSGLPEEPAKAQAAPAKKLATVVPSNASEPPKPKGHHYPVRGGHWSVNGDWTPSKAELIRHLLADGMHRGKFTEAYLEGLSREELLSLHDDDHEFKVQARYVQRPVQQQVFTYQQQCPGGVCPAKRRRR